MGSSARIWRRLSYSLLDEPMCRLHVALHERAGGTENTTFWRKFFQKAQELEEARWSSDLRSAFLASYEGVEAAVVGSGHCVSCLGDLVVKTGGLRPQCQLEHIHT